MPSEPPLPKKQNEMFAGNVAEPSRGGCRVCGQVGHLAKQCRNRLAVTSAGAVVRVDEGGGGANAAAGAAGQSASAAAAGGHGLDVVARAATAAAVAAAAAAQAALATGADTVRLAISTYQTLLASDFREEEIEVGLVEGGERFRVLALAEVRAHLDAIAARD